MEVRIYPWKLEVIEYTPQTDISYTIVNYIYEYYEQWILYQTVYKKVKEYIMNYKPSKVISQKTVKNKEFSKLINM